MAQLWREIWARGQRWSWDGVAYDEIVAFYALWEDLVPSVRAFGERVAEYLDEQYANNDIGRTFRSFMQEMINRIFATIERAQESLQRRTEQMLNDVTIYLHDHGPDPGAGGVGAGAGGRGTGPGGGTGGVVVSQSQGSSGAGAQSGGSGDGTTQQAMWPYEEASSPAGLDKIILMNSWDIGGAWMGRWDTTSPNAFVAVNG